MKMNIIIINDKGGIQMGFKEGFSGEEQQLQTNMKVDGMKADEVQL